MVTVDAGWATDRGRVRAVNEDSVLAAAPVFAVADGMGGHAAGDVASQTAVRAMAELAEREVLTPEDVVRCIATTNEELLVAASPFPERRGMGTTLAGIAMVTLAGTQHWCVFNVGDSRVYRFAEHELRMMSVDHSEVAELIAAGEITAEEARSHPHRSVVTRSLGTEPGPSPDVWVIPPTPGERFLICSDGLSNEVADEKIAAVMGGRQRAAATAEALVRMAVEAGGRDNVSAVVVDVVLTAEGTPIDDTTTPRAHASAGKGGS